MCCDLSQVAVAEIYGLKDRTVRQVLFCMPIEVQLSRHVDGLLSLACVSCVCALQAIQEELSWHARRCAAPGCTPEVVALHVDWEDRVTLLYEQGRQGFRGPCRQGSPAGEGGV